TQRQAAAAAQGGDPTAHSGRGPVESRGTYPDANEDSRGPQGGGAFIVDRAQLRGCANARGTWRSILSGQPSACTGTVRARGQLLLWPTNEPDQDRAEGPAPGDLRIESLCGARWPDVLRGGLRGPVAPIGWVCRQDPQGGQAW